MKAELQTGDLLLKPAHLELAESLLAYYLKNRPFLEGFEPKREPSFYTYEFQKAQLDREAAETADRTSFHFYISLKDDDKAVIGSVALNNVVWGCFLSCYLGYKLDGGLIGRGYMTQAVRAVTEFAFGGLGLHRIEGNVMPRNKPSLRVLEKCGFKNEGLSEKYLKINGVWEDHIHMVLLNNNL